MLQVKQHSLTALSLDFQVMDMLNGRAEENLEILDDLVVRLGQAGFIVEIDEVPGSQMKLFALKEVKQSYLREAKASKDDCAPWGPSDEAEARKMIASIIDEEKK